MAESALNTPMLWINTYLQEKLATSGLELGVPFFPSLPSDINTLTEQWITVDDVRYPFGGVMATWDRMFRMRRGPFPHIKYEQALYYFYGLEQNAAEKMIQVQELIYRFMDRGDETAQEINEWASNRDIDGLENRFHFHDFKVYQLEEVRDIIDFGTARTYAGNKIIIEYTYHQVGSDGKVL